MLPIITIGLAGAGLWSALAPQPGATAPIAAAGTVAAAVSAATSTTADAVPTTTASTIAPTTTSGAPPLPVPDGPPVDARADVTVVAVGRISIPAIGLDHEIYEGVWLTVIDVGPGHWPGTPMPGGYGNSVFAGHRVTRSHPFFDLDRLVAGDEIVFTMVDGTRHVYRVTEQFIVEPRDLWIVDQAPGRTLTLFACHPKGSARQRIVVRAALDASGEATT